MKKIIVILAGVILLTSTSLSADDSNKCRIQVVKAKIEAVNWEYNYNQIRQRELIKLSTSLQAELKKLLMPNKEKDETLFEVKPDEREVNP